MATKSHSAEWNDRVAEALRGRKLSEEHRRAISDGLRRSTCHGRVHMRAGFIAGLAIGVGFRVRGETV